MKTHAKEQLKSRESKSILPNDFVVVLGTATFAALFGGMMMWALIKENTHPAWFWIILAFSALMFLVLTIAFLPSRELKLADRLSRSGQVDRATGRVMKMRRVGTRESNTMRETELGLELLLSGPDGGERTVEVEVWVEDVMMHNFATGSTVHVLYDPADPSKVAIDRQLSPVQIL
ncbi:MAG TPA: DUF3592 domain-containing protein [Eoetvoesiella sp.]